MNELTKPWTLKRSDWRDVVYKDKNITCSCIDVRIYLHYGPSCNLQNKNNSLLDFQD